MLLLWPLEESGVPNDSMDEMASDTTRIPSALSDDDSTRLLFRDVVVVSVAGMRSPVMAGLTVWRCITEGEKDGENEALLLPVMRFEGVG